MTSLLFREQILPKFSSALASVCVLFITEGTLCDVWGSSACGQPGKKVSARLVPAAFALTTDASFS